MQQHSEDHSPTLPPSGAPAKPPTRKVIDFAAAKEAMHRVPVLDESRRRMWRDWQRGARPRDIRNTYGWPKPLLVDEVDDVLRAQTQARLWELERRKAA